MTVTACWPGAACHNLPELHPVDAPHSVTGIAVHDLKFRAMRDPAGHTPLSD
jgi:hypothetical protein